MAFVDPVRDQDGRNVLTCTPEWLTNDAPATKCLACLSESELMMLLLYVFMYAFGEQGDLAGVLDASKCFDCLSDKQKLQAVVASVAWYILEDDLTADEVREIIKCFVCVPPGKIKGALVRYICRYMNVLQNPS